MFLFEIEIFLIQKEVSQMQMDIYNFISDSIL